MRFDTIQPLSIQLPKLPYIGCRALRQLWMILGLPTPSGRQQCLSLAMQFYFSLCQVDKVRRSPPRTRDAVDLSDHFRWILHENPISCHSAYPYYIQT